MWSYFEQFVLFIYLYLSLFILLLGIYFIFCLGKGFFLYQSLENNQMISFRRTIGFSKCAKTRAFVLGKKTSSWPEFGAVTYFKKHYELQKISLRTSLPSNSGHTTINSYCMQFTYKKNWLILYRYNGVIWNISANFVLCMFYKSVQGPDGGVHAMLNACCF